MVGRPRSNGNLRAPYDPTHPIEVRIGRGAVRLAADLSSATFATGSVRAGFQQDLLKVSHEDLLRIAFSILTRPEITTVTPHLALPPELAPTTGLSEDERQERIKGFKASYVESFGDRRDHLGSSAMLTSVRSGTQFTWGTTLSLGGEVGSEGNLELRSSGVIPFPVFADAIAAIVSDPQTKRLFPKYYIGYLRRFGEQAFEGTTLKSGIPTEIRAHTILQTPEDDDEPSLFSLISSSLSSTESITPPEVRSVETESATAPTSDPQRESALPSKTRSAVHSDKSLELVHEEDKDESLNAPELLGYSDRELRSLSSQLSKTRDQLEQTRKLLRAQGVASIKPGSHSGHIKHFVRAMQQVEEERNEVRKSQERINAQHDEIRKNRSVLSNAEDRIRIRQASLDNTQKQIDEKNREVQKREEAVLQREQILENFETHSQLALRLNELSHEIKAREDALKTEKDALEVERVTLQDQQAEILRRMLELDKVSGDVDMKLRQIKEIEKRIEERLVKELIRPDDRSGK